MDAPNVITAVTPAQAEVIRQLRFRERFHLAALLAEQENAEARVLAEHRATQEDPYAAHNSPFRSFGRVAPINSSTEGTADV